MCDCESINKLTVIAQQEFIIARAEHPHRATALTPFCQLLESRIIALRNCDTLEAKGKVLGAVH